MTKSKSGFFLIREEILPEAIKKTIKVKMSDSSTYYFKVFYSTAELKKLFPGVPILCYNREMREYVDMV